MGLQYDMSNTEAIKLAAQDAGKRKQQGRTCIMQFIDVEEEPEKKRTNTQNKAMHKYFSLLAEALNDAGYDMKRTMKPEAEIPWTPHAVKSHLWKVIEHAMFGHESTTQLSTKQCSEVYEVVNRKIASTTGVSVPWPSLESQSRASQ